MKIGCILPDSPFLWPKNGENRHYAFKLPLSIADSSKKSILFSTIRPVHNKRLRVGKTLLAQFLMCVRFGLKGLKVHDTKLGRAKLRRSLL